MAAAYFDLEVTQKAELFAFLNQKLCWIRYILRVEPIEFFKIAKNCAFDRVFTGFFYRWVLSDTLHIRGCIFLNRQFVSLNTCDNGRVKRI
jgi:hypothetical protein